MWTFLLALAVLLVASTWFILAPLWRENADAGGAETGEAGPRLSATQQEAVRRELLWRIEHDREAGRLTTEEYEEALVRAGAGGAGEPASD